MLSAEYMRPARDPVEFLAAPVGRCVVGPTFVMWCAAPDLVGAIQWGTLDSQGVRDLITILDFVRHPDRGATGRALIDCRDVDRVDGDVLVELAASASGPPPPPGPPRLERQLVVVPEGVAGILLAGALPSLAQHRPLRFVRDLDLAFDLVDHPAARAAHAAAARVAMGERGQSALLRRVRVELARDLAEATIERCANALWLSTRTLQRGLHRLATSFSDELRRARVAAAEEMLCHSNMKIEAIATRVGLGTASRLSATLRRERNATASELRARCRDRVARVDTPAHG